MDIKDKTLETRKIVLAHNLVEKTDTMWTLVRHHTDVVIINLKIAGDASRGWQWHTVMGYEKNYTIDSCYQKIVCLTLQLC